MSAPSAKASPALRSILAEMTLLHLVFGAGLLIRIMSAYLFAGEIDGEGAEYGRIAENLLLGNGYSGIATEGTQLFFPPLFPFLIAAVSLLTDDAGIAARAINVVCGALLVYPVFLITQKLSGNGIIAAAIAAFHPTLIYFSTTGHVEPFYMTLIMAAVYGSMLVAERLEAWLAVLTGVLYGLAYLTRQEAFVFMLVGLFFAVVGRWLMMQEQWLRMSRNLVLLIATFVVVAGPYIAWLSAQTGALKIEAKSPLNLITELRIQQGLSIDEAGMGVAHDLTPAGVWMVPNLDVIQGAEFKVRDTVFMMAKKAPSVLSDAADYLASSLSIGSPVLMLLAALGLFARPWTRVNAPHQLHLLAIFALSVFATFFIYYSGTRFYLVCIVLMIIWSASGFRVLADWASGSAESIGFGARAQAASVGTVMALIVLAMGLPSAAKSAGLFLKAHASQTVASASGEFGTLRQDLKLADTSTVFAFHARSGFVWLPYAHEETALRYLAAKNVTHVVIRHDALSSRPYLKRWAADGVPGGKLVLATASGFGERVEVYEMVERPRN